MGGDVFYGNTAEILQTRRQRFKARAVADIIRDVWCYDSCYSNFLSCKAVL